MLLRSQIRCPWCDELIASIDRHDFRSCSCGKTSIDGGRDYLRVLYTEPKRPEDCSIRIKEELPLKQAADCLAVLRGLALIAPHDEPRAWVPLSVVQGSLSANVIWPARGFQGLPADHKVSDYSTKKWLDLLVRNKLVHLRTKGNNGRYRYWYQAAVEIAPHPEVPDGLTPGS